MPYLNEHAELYGFTTKKISNTIRLKYKVDGVVYYSDMPPVDGHYNLNVYTNFIAFVLYNTKDLKVETFPSQFDFIVYPD